MIDDLDISSFEGLSHILLQDPKVLKHVMYKMEVLSNLLRNPEVERNLGFDLGESVDFFPENPGVLVYFLFSPRVV